MEIVPIKSLAIKQRTNPILLPSSGARGCATVWQAITALIRLRYNGLSTEDKVDLRRALITYLQRICSTQEQASKFYTNTLTYRTGTFVKNKLAQLFALLFKLDFLTTWPTFIDDLLLAVCAPDPSSNHLAIVDMFLRILHSIDEEVVSFDVVRDREEQKHNQDIVRKHVAFHWPNQKDKMRESAVPRIVETLYNLLMTYGNNNEIVKNILQNIADYIRMLTYHVDSHAKNGSMLGS